MSESVVIEQPGVGLVVRRVSARDRLRARFCFASLDIALADGEAPEARAALCLRAASLITPRMRRRLARSLRTIGAAPRRPAVHLRTWVGPHVRLAAPELLALADRLEQPGPVSVRGVALVCVLLTDGNGPLHRNEGAEPLIRAARVARWALAFQPERGAWVT